MPSPQKATIKGGSAAGAGHIAIGKAVIFPLGAPAAALASRGLIMARIKLKHVNSFSDRYGKVRHYFRKRGCRDVMLPGQPGSAEFMAAYGAALNNAAPIVIGAKRVAAGTVAALCVLRPSAIVNKIMGRGCSHSHRIQGDALERLATAE